MYIEGIIHLLINWKMAYDNCSIVGCLPVPALTESFQNNHFELVQSHIRTRLKFSGSDTSTDPRHPAHCYDMLTNFPVNHEDTGLILKRYLAVVYYKHGRI